MPIESGQTFSHYQIVEKLGQGGMGMVWKALDTVLQRPVAIKVLPEAWASDPDRLARFEHEARVVAALNHPNIVTIHSVEEAEGIRFITMEMIEGRTLDRIIPVGGLALPTLLEIAVAVADAVAAAHARGIAHRDLKPMNIMVTDDERVKVLDFGLARTSGTALPPTSSASWTETTEEATPLSGTLPYMSPEQLRGLPPDHRSDIFALGVILFEMAIGHRPFAGATPAETMASILKDAPEDVCSLRAELPERFGRIAARCMEKEPSRRLQAALDLRMELEELLGAPTAPRPPAAPSVAVLPFADMSQNHDQQYLCDGIAEEIINLLARVEQLKVASRTSAFQFKTAALDSREIGRRLGVRTLLEGSIRKAEDRLRVTVGLSSVADGYCLWSERFDREAKDVFAIQDEIAHRVVDALQVTLSPSERQAMRRQPTRDVEAYEFYLRGRSFYHQFSRNGMELASKMFRRATEIDPGYALAHAGIADCYSFLYMHAMGTEADREAAEAASLKALQLDPDQAVPHASRGLALSLGRKHEEAEAEFKAAIRLEPRSFEAHYYYARDCFMRDDLPRAAELFERAFELRPEDYQSPLIVAQVYEALGRPTDAQAVRRRGLKVAEERLRLHPDDTRALYMGANALVALGERGRGLEWAQRAFAREPNDSVVLYNLGCICSLAGEVEEALDFLMRAVRAGMLYDDWIRNDSNLDPVRSHPRYQEVLREIEVARAQRSGS